MCVREREKERVRKEMETKKRKFDVLKKEMQRGRKIQGNGEQGKRGKERE